MTQTRPTWIPGNSRAHMTAKMVIASAERLIEVRHFCRKRKRIAEISVPAWPIPIQNTKFVMSNAQPTGTLSPQMPIPSQKSHETATPRTPRSATAGMKKNHQPIGVFRSTGSATASVIEWKSGERRMSVGLPATGLSSSSASVWAKALPPLRVPSSESFHHRDRASQARITAIDLIRSPFFVVFDERCEAVLAEVLARVEKDQDDDHGARSDRKGGIVEPAEAVVGGQCESDHHPDDREREKQLLAPKRAFDKALLTVRRQFRTTRRSANPCSPAARGSRRWVPSRT